MDGRYRLEVVGGRYRLEADQPVPSIHLLMAIYCWVALLSGWVGGAVVLRGQSEGLRSGWGRGGRGTGEGGTVGLEGAMGWGQVCTSMQVGSA